MIAEIQPYIYDTAPKKAQRFWELYKKKRGYTNPTVTMHQCLEVLRVLVHNPEMYEGGFKTNVIELESIIFGYEGDEPIYSLFTEANQAILRALYLRSLQNIV
jgi:hypothetical protein